MRDCEIRHCYVIVILAFLMLPGATYADSGFYAESDRLPATIEPPPSDCEAYAQSKSLPEAEYGAGSTVATGVGVPAGIAPQNPQAYPVVRFDLRPVRQKKTRLKPTRINRGQLRAGNVSVGEVSIDTQTGSVALDGNSLMPADRAAGCYRRSRP